MCGTHEHPVGPLAAREPSWPPKAPLVPEASSVSQWASLTIQQRPFGRTTGALFTDQKPLGCAVGLLDCPVVPFLAKLWGPLGLLSARWVPLSAGYTPLAARGHLAGCQGPFAARRWLY